MSRRSRKETNKWKSDKFTGHLSYCEDCAKLGFPSRRDARNEVKKYPNLKRAYYCTISKTYHVTKMSLEEYSGEDMATGVKVSKDIETFLKSEWDSHHKYKMTTNEVLRKFPEVRTQAIYSAISRMKKSGILIALDEKSPGRGGQYFALTSVIDEMTSSENAKEESNVNKIPEQAKPEFPVANPFDDVHKKLDQLLKFKPPTYDTIDINALVDNLLTQRNLDGERIVRNITKSNEVVMLTTLNRVLQPEMDGLKQYLTGQNSHTREYILNMKNALSDEIKAMHQPVISDDYQRGLRDGIKLAVDMGLMIPKES